jgi:blocked-early-in-transport protein 1
MCRRQNDSRLDELASKVSALRGVTIDIYDNARDQHVIDSTVRLSTHLPYPYPISTLTASYSIWQDMANPPQTQSETFSSMGTSLKGSASRLTRMAQSGNKVAILKLSGMLIGAILVLYWIWHLIF